mmetsp:Transcript_23417/g.56541  ORF Transcript_23417/g.56541 Transcript_23417/m.56541 type:complete len:405 (+) Transcript_23417:67-1281(+)|eukprot:CAMPEP_0181101944 /NCGR_PEP_ID=MMETSP1071-20121207/14039_1 /TAXON_ID=35127 /ORGANISM="Thalassiosira sp., Strain NH16" /LENGTH=404 /DNA_ID=CAMNT_0023184859 /DNA_START=54 /DNA_END=1268 /DNA_ORIENTATION=+
MANKKHMKVGLALMAVVALGIGIGIGTKKKRSGVASGSAKSQELEGLDSVYDIDCEVRRNLVVPGTEDYHITVPAKRRWPIVRRLGTDSSFSNSSGTGSGPRYEYESEIVTTTYGSKPYGSETETVATTNESGSNIEQSAPTSSKSSKSGSLAGTGSKSTKSSKSGSKSSGSSSLSSGILQQKCTKPSMDELCQPSKKESEKSGRRKLEHGVVRELGKEAEAIDTDQYEPQVPGQGEVSAVSVTSKSSKSSKSNGTKSSKSSTPTTCMSEPSSDGLTPLATPPLEDTKKPTSQLVPQSTIISTGTPTYGSSDSSIMRPPGMAISQATRAPASKLPTPSPSYNPTTQEPSPFPTTLQPTKPPTDIPTNKPTNSPTTIPTYAVSFGSTPTVSTEVTGPPTMPDRAE